MNGILGDRRARRPLGAYTSTIPSNCWNVAGFKDCNAIQYDLAKAYCQGVSQDNDACIGPLADKYTMSACKCTAAVAPAVATKTTPTLVTTSSAPKTTASKTSDASAAPGPTILGMDMKTVATVAVVGVGLYLYMTRSSK